MHRGRSAAQQHAGCAHARVSLSETGQGYTHTRIQRGEAVEGPEIATQLGGPYVTPGVGATSFCAQYSVICSGTSYIGDVYTCAS